MRLVKRLDRNAGIAMRWVANLLTGNYFLRIEKRLERIESHLEKRDPSDDMAAAIQLLFDRQQEDILEDFEKRIRNK